MEEDLEVDVLKPIDAAQSPARMAWSVSMHGMEASPCGNGECPGALRRGAWLKKLGGGGSKATSSMVPFASRAVTSASMKGMFVPCEGDEKTAPGQESGEET
jgi:hypothetical protein